MIPILFQDKDLLVCLKPPGLLSQTGPVDSLPALLEQENGCRIFPVHRLDQSVGGVMAYAKTSSAAAALSAAIRAGTFQKEYLAAVRGCPKKAAGVYQDLLLHDRVRNKSFVVQRMRGGVREASLEYRLLEEQEGLSLVLIRLHTGRTHQIRVQFASRGMPLAGDNKYGGGSGQIALWSFRIKLPHPTSGQQMVFQQSPSGEPWERFTLH